jgi:hemolysin activation/secretion protein
MIKPPSFFFLKVILVTNLLVAQQVNANGNPEDTLPKVESAKAAPSTPVDINRSTEVVDPKLNQLLATKLTVENFDIQGVKSIPLEEVNAIYRPYVNQSLSLKEVIELTSKVTKLYANKGYPLSFAYIPAQDFGNHKVTVLVIEGYVGLVSLQGDYGPTESKIRSIVEPMLKEKPLTQKTMERSNSLLSLLPGLAIQASLLLPERRDGSSELKIVATRTLISAGLNLESLRPEARAIITVQSAGQTAAAEQFSFSTLASQQDEEYYAASYSQMIGSKGLILKLNSSMYEGSSDNQLPPDLTSSVFSLRLSSSLSYPILINRNESLIGTVALSTTNYEDKIQSKDTFRSITQKTNSRALAVGATYSTLSASQSRSLQLILTKGLDILGASKSAKTNFVSNQKLVNPDDISFTKLNFTISQNNAFSYGIGTSMSLSAQYSQNQLPQSERIQFGGFQYGRAFVPGFLSGDSGWGLAFELNKQLPTIYDFSYFKLVAVQPYGLFESARTIQNFDAIDSRNIEYLTSLSLGLRLKADVGGTVDISLAKALGSKSLNKEPSGLIFSLNYELLLN